MTRTGQGPSWYHKFTGKERDSESGLENFGARLLTSSMGRWMSPDAVNLKLNELRCKPKRDHRELRLTGKRGPPYGFALSKSYNPKSWLMGITPVMGQITKARSGVIS